MAERAVVITRGYSLALLDWIVFQIRGRWGGALVPFGVSVIAGMIVAGAIFGVPFHGSGPTPPGSCASSTSNVPDGPDPWGGCFPGPSNTGPSAPEGTMTAYTGSCNITTANTTISSKVINCSPLNVAASGLLITNSYLKGGVTQSNGTPSFTIQDSQIDNQVLYPACTSPSSCDAGYYACGDPHNATTDCGVTGSNFTLTRVEVMHTNRGAYCQAPGPCLIQDSYFHGTNLWPDHTNEAHASGVRNEQYLTLRHNSVHCSYEGPFPNGEIGCSADMSGYPDFAPIKYDTIDKNLFVANNIGNGYCAYGGATVKDTDAYRDPTNDTYIVFTDNVFQKGANGVCGAYGHVTDFNGSRTGNVWSGNTFDDGTTAGPG